MISYDHIFQVGAQTPPTQTHKAPQPDDLPTAMDVDADKKKDTPLNINFVKQVNSLDYQLTKMDKRNFGKKHEFVTNEYIDAEMNRARLKQSWGKMDKCFQWQFIQEYLDTVPGITDKDRQSIMKLFKKDKLPDVIYSTKEKKIERLNINFQTLNI